MKQNLDLFIPQQIMESLFLENIYQAGHWQLLCIHHMLSQWDMTEHVHTFF